MKDELPSKLNAIYAKSRAIAKQNAEQRSNKLSREIANMFNQHAHGRLWIYGDSK